MAQKDDYRCSVLNVQAEDVVESGLQLLGLHDFLLFSWGQSIEFADELHRRVPFPVQLSRRSVDN